MKTIDPKTIVLQFNDCINNRDIDGLAHLMMEDHVFIDTQKNHICGKQNCLSVWKEFFNLFPDYKNTFKTIVSMDYDVVKINGFARCSDKRLEGLFIWTAKIKNNKVAEWCVKNTVKI